MECLIKTSKVHMKDVIIEDDRDGAFLGKAFQVAYIEGLGHFKKLNTEFIKLMMNG